MAFVFIFYFSLSFSTILPNCLAISRPIPEEPPVTSTVCLEFQREREREKESMAMSKSKKHRVFLFFLFRDLSTVSNFSRTFPRGGPGGREIPAAGRRGPSRWGSRRKERRARECWGKKAPKRSAAKLSLSLSFLFCSRTSELFANQPLFHFPPRSVQPGIQVPGGLPSASGSPLAPSEHAMER